MRISQHPQKVLPIRFRGTFTCRGTGRWTFGNSSLGAGNFGRIGDFDRRAPGDLLRPFLLLLPVRGSDDAVFFEDFLKLKRPMLMFDRWINRWEVYCCFCEMCRWNETLLNQIVNDLVVFYTCSSKTYRSFVSEGSWKAVASKKSLLSDSYPIRCRWNSNSHRWIHTSIF